MHHLATASLLDGLRLELKYGAIAADEAVQRLSAIATEYAFKLPVAGRESNTNKGGSSALPDNK